MTTSLLSDPTPQAGAPQPPRLLDQVTQASRQRGASEPTTAQLVSWVRAYILFHGKRHPRELNLGAVSRFLEHVVRTEKQPLAALELARSALELLYDTVLGIDLGELPRPQPPRLMDQMSQVLRVRHYSPRTEAYYAAAGLRGHLGRAVGLIPGGQGGSTGRGVNPAVRGGQSTGRTDNGACSVAHSGLQYI
jgi:hypothetical protein